MHKYDKFQLFIYLRLVYLTTKLLTHISKWLDDTEQWTERNCLQNREYGCRDPSQWPCDTLYQQK
jgi:hypothetical protein